MGDTSNCYSMGILILINAHLLQPGLHIAGETLLIFLHTLCMPCIKFNKRDCGRHLGYSFECFMHYVLPIYKRSELKLTGARPIVFQSSQGTL